MPAPKYLINGVGGNQQVLTVQSGGSASADKIPALNSADVLDQSLLPAGVGLDIVPGVVTSEALTAGDMVNLYQVSGATRVRKADSTTLANGKKTGGFVLATTASGGSVDVYRSGLNTSLSGLSPGLDYYMGPAGTVTLTRPTSGTEQVVGTAISATTLDVQLQPATGLV